MKPAIIKAELKTETNALNSANGRFSAALWQTFHAGRMPVIPDIKRKSPAEGDLFNGRDPVALAKSLAKAGVPALSVVTEAEQFGGSPQLLRQIAGAVSLPVLRKDFIMRREQLLESVDIGASAVLLIASMLKKELLFELFEEALALGLEPLVETHDEGEIMAVRELDLTLLGINNRNIAELELDGGNVGTTERLAALAKPDVLVVSESSIAAAEDVERAAKAGAHAALVGTAILKAPDPAEMFRKLSVLRR